MEPYQHVAQTLGHNLPAHRSFFGVGMIYAANVGPFACGVVRDERRGVVVFAEKVERGGDGLEVAFTNLPASTRPDCPLPMPADTFP